MAAIDSCIESNMSSVVGFGGGSTGAGLSLGILPVRRGLPLEPRSDDCEWSPAEVKERARLVGVFVRGFAGAAV